MVAEAISTAQIGSHPRMHEFAGLVISQAAIDGMSPDQEAEIERLSGIMGSGMALAQVLGEIPTAPKQPTTTQQEDMRTGTAWVGN